jgi:hypothetical protein
VETIKRDIYNKMSIIGLVVPGVEIQDIDLATVATEDMAELNAKLTADTTVFSFVKGSGVTLFVAPDATVPLPRYKGLLAKMHIKVKVSAKLSKRAARLFSDRDVVAHLSMDSINMEIIPGDEFNRGTFTDPDDIDALQDGMIAISKSFAKSLIRKAGLKVSILKGAEALSFSMVCPRGFLKALAYIVDDEKMVIPGAHIITCQANIKSEMWTTDGMAWVAFDVFRPYSDPKTNIQTDIMLREILGNQGLDAQFLTDVLAKDKRNIMNGTAVKSLQEWNMPSLERKLGSSNKVTNKDFAALPDMATDMMARGLDYRWFPGLIDMLASGASNQWFNNAGEWAKYPLPCAWSRPIISESGACLIGEEITVNRGDIRSIKHGEVWVVNDEDYIEFFRTNAGGADLDDHFMLIFRRVEGVRKVVVGRIPMGWREFSVFNFVDGDPFPTYTSLNGVFKAFPEIPGSIPKTLHECLRDGDMTITGLGTLTPLTYPAEYDHTVVMNIVNDLCSGELGNVGSIINAIMVAATVNPALLAEVPASMETIIDSFTQGGGSEVRKALTIWSEALICMMDARGNQLDVIFTANKAVGRRGRLGNYKVRAATLVRGEYSQRMAANLGLRNSFVKEIKDFGQDYNRKGNPLLLKAMAMFNMRYSADISNTADPLFVGMRRITKQFNGDVLTYNEINNEGRGQGEAFIPMTQAQWLSVYTNYKNRVSELAGGDARKMELCTIIGWMICMTIPSRKGRISDRALMNSTMWPIFIQALVNFGLAKDLDKVVAGEQDTINTWDVTCKTCGASRTLADVSNYARFISNDCLCKNCKG